MLQQTVVSVVVPRYKEWMDRFPEVASLAKIDEEQVLRAWEGLGYYSRARNIHRGAKVLTQDGHSQPPNDLVYLRSLPGIGEYTAAAILSFAYGRPEPVFDANVRRLLARLSASDSKTDQDLWREYYLALLGNHPPEVVNAALMQFGQLVCQSKNPSCLLCPLVDLCQAYQRDCVGDFPKKTRRTTIKSQSVALAVVSPQGLRLRKGREGLFRDLWLFPTISHKEWSQLESTKAYTLEKKVFTHYYTNHIEKLSLWVGSEVQSDPLEPWLRADTLIPWEKVASLPMPSTHRQILKFVRKISD
jgi:A/G-specific adenine glycosylase